MLKPVKMQKLRIIVASSVLDSVIALLHRLEMIEIQTSNYKELQNGKPLDFYDSVSGQLVRLRAILNNLIPKENIKLAKMDSSEALEKAKHMGIDEDIRKIVDTKSLLESKQNKIFGEVKLLENLLVFKSIDFSKLKTKTLTYLVGIIHNSDLDKCSARLKKISPDHKMLSNPTNETISTVVIIYKKINEQGEEINIEAHLNDFGFNPVLLPDGITTPGAYYGMLSGELKDIKIKITELNNKLVALSNKHYESVYSITKALAIEADRAEIASKFGFTKSVAIITGWIKQEDFEKLQMALFEFGNKVVIEKVEESYEELPPTVLNNPQTASQMEFITKTFSLPNAREIDPTLIYFITLPLIYGMIVGDVVYGILSLLIASFFEKKFAKSVILTNVARIWKISALPTVVFGLIFDEWAGLSHYHILENIGKWGLDILSWFSLAGPLYEGMSRIHNVTLLIGITAIVGLFHLALGFLLGAINEWNHNRRHAYGKLAWIGIELGGTVAIMAMLFNMLPVDFGTAGLGLLILSAIVVVWSEGIVGFLEIPGLAGNVLSYTRIAAIGVVGVIIAEIINEFFLPIPAQGLLAILFFPLFVVLHIVNAFIAMFEALIQGGRLNIIEFRSKFLHGGGKPFEPFAISYSI